MRSIPRLLMITLAAFVLETTAAAKFGFGPLDGAVVALVPTGVLFGFGFWGYRSRLLWLLVGVAVSLVVFGLIALAFVFFNPDFQSVTGPNAQIIPETSRVLELMRDQVVRDEESAERLSRHPVEATPDLISEMRRDPAKYYPGRKEFLEEMAREPSVTIRRRTFCKIIGTSKAPCVVGPFSIPTFVRVRITSGPEKGVEGWTCGSIEPAIETP
jgi:hypothetical protein